MASKRHKGLKRTFTVSISVDVLERFRQYVLKRCGTGYGKTSACVEEALADFIKRKVKA